MTSITGHYSRLADAASKTLISKDYRHDTRAEALLFRMSSSDNTIVTKGLRLEAPDIGKEFTDNVPIGKDPAGVLYYDSLQDLKHGRHVTYQIKSKKHDGKEYMWIGFYKESVDNCHAEFVAHDYTRDVAAMGMNGYSHKGKWVDLSICTAAAIVDKRSDETSIILSAKGLVKSAKIPEKDLNGKKVSGDFTVKGELWFKNIKDISSGVSASYNNDRIVFMRASYQDPTDFTAYFIPYEGPDEGDANLHVKNTSTRTYGPGAKVEWVEEDLLD